MQIDDRTEWLETDGLGGFASGTTSGMRTRRYHALLLPATTPPTGRIVLVNGFDAWVDSSEGTAALTTQRYVPDILHPDGASRIVAFRLDPWPTWEFECGNGIRLRQEIFVRHGTGATVIAWEVLRASGPLMLRVRPFLSGRDYHSTHHENGAFRFDANTRGGTVSFAPYDGLPRIEFRTNGDYRHAPEWYRQFLYSSERERGLDDSEDLASPGEFAWTLPAVGSQAVCIMSATPIDAPPGADDSLAIGLMADSMRGAERARRAAFPSTLDRAADAYLVRRRAGRTIIAGYPWFTDWGRDTFIALRGLCLATGRLTDARDILLEWAATVSEGMLPNRFPDRGEEPEFNSVDASLWYVVAVHEFLCRAAEVTGVVSREDEEALRNAVEKIVGGYAKGTRFGIRMDQDGLLQAGLPGWQLTWMDARVGEHVITPRIGKPVEIQALWLNAVLAASVREPRWLEVFERGRAAFNERFWNEALGHLADVVDVDHRPGSRDDTFRPNQVLAVGGLPVALVDGERARRVVNAVEQRLLTPLGLRSLARGEEGYSARYEGDSSSRDAVYHQGTVWPWLIGPFVDAWLRVRGNTKTARAEARRRFVTPLLDHLDAAGLGHVSEIADAEPPFTPRGCPFQAWSLGELLRVERQILVDVPRRTRRRSAQPQLV